ncbi:hypothetical protein NECID01_1001 [Nematocida sp. AWRm77]|nr:hypothetical protein NECID01_1001 [Nematocida sp. AWRm77]
MPEKASHKKQEKKMFSRALRALQRVYVQYCAWLIRAAERSICLSCFTRRCFILFLSEKCHPSPAITFNLCNDFSHKKVLYIYYFITPTILMNKFAAQVLILFLALASIRSAHVSVIFTLGDGEKVHATVPQEAFEDLESSDNYNSYMLKRRCTSETKKKKNYVNIEVKNLPDITAYTHFMSLCCADTPFGSLENQSEGAESSLPKQITKTAFKQFLLTAADLKIQGKYAQCFFKNMLFYGLLGEHSESITKMRMDEEYEVNEIICQGFWHMLIAFLSQMDLQHNLRHPCAEQPVLMIKAAATLPELHSGTSMEEMLFSMSKVELHSKIPGETDSKRQRNEAVFEWLLLHIKCPFVDLCYLQNINAQPFPKFKANIVGVTVVGLTLTVNSTDVDRILNTLHTISPSLMRLKLNSSESSVQNSVYFRECSSITNCSVYKSLKELKIKGFYADTYFVTRTLPMFSSLKTLCLVCEELDPTAANAFANCMYLSTLVLFGKEQASGFIQRLAECLPRIRDLEVRCTTLEPEAADAFKKCRNLRILLMRGMFQTDEFFQRLLRSISGIKVLELQADNLEDMVADSFSNCPQLEHLGLWSGTQTATFLERLLKHLPRIRKLRIVCDLLERIEADAFKMCQNLESLTILEMCQDGIFIKKLAEFCPNIKELVIDCCVLYAKDADSFKGHRNLTSLVIEGDRQTSDFLQGLLRTLPESIQELKLNCTILEDGVADSFVRLPGLTSLSLLDDPQTPSFIGRLLLHIPRVRCLKVVVSVLNQELANALRTLRLLKVLTLHGLYVPGFISALLQDQDGQELQTLQNLKVLVINMKNESQVLPNKKDIDAIEIAKQKGIYASYYWNQPTPY